jgi:hypothetical protein
MNQVSQIPPGLPNIIIDNPIIEVVEVLTPGPQGPPGDPSSLTGSFVNIDNFNTFTSSYNTGSFTGSFIGDGSQLTGINTSKWTGSFDGSISRDSDVFITGSLIVSTKENSLTSSVFLIKNYENINLLNLQQNGVLILSTQSVELNEPAPNGGIYFTSNSFFVGIN